MYWSVFAGMVIIALGGVHYLKPNIIWKLTQQWKSYSSDEPSELYIKSTKVGGVLFAFIGIVMMLLPFVLK